MKKFLHRASEHPGTPWMAILFIMGMAAADGALWGGAVMLLVYGAPWIIYCATGKDILNL